MDASNKVDLNDILISKLISGLTYFENVKNILSYL